MNSLQKVQLMCSFSFLFCTWIQSAEVDYSSSSTTVAMSSLLPVINLTLPAASTRDFPDTLNTSLLSPDEEYLMYNDNSTDYQLPDLFVEKNDSGNDTGVWTRVTSTYSRITTQFSPFSPRMQKRQMKSKQMMKMMKMTSKMNMMTNMMNAMMKYKSKS